MPLGVFEPITHRTPTIDHSTSNHVSSKGTILTEFHYIRVTVEVIQGAVIVAITHCQSDKPTGFG